MRYLFALLPLAASPLLAQALVSNTLAISSGSVAGSYAGKGIQEKTGTIFSKTGDTLDMKGKVALPKWNTSPEALTSPGAKMPPAPEFVPAPGGSRRTGPGIRTPRGQLSPLAWKAATIPEATPAFLVPTVEAPLPDKPVSREMLSEIVTGTSRDELIARLGMPASRVNIPTGGTLEEIYYYTRAGEILGAVRVVDDSVSRVDINR